MRKRRKIDIARLVSCIFMMLALAWLTVSFPVMYHVQLKAEQQKAAKADTAQNDEEASNNFGNTTEEKTPGGSNSFSEEYLHDTHAAEHYVAFLSFKYYVEHYPTYIAFYGDLESPPPDQA